MAGGLDRVLVTGAGGMLGRRVVAELAGKGHAIHGTDVAMPPDWDRTHAFTATRLQDWAELESVVAASDVVIHTAAITNLDSHPERVVFDNNVTATSRLVYAAANARIGRFIYASSQSALGFSRALTILRPDYLPVDEDHPCHLTEGYGLSKVVGEQLCRVAGYRYGLRTLSLRFPVIWAPENFAQHVAKRSGDPVQAAKSMWSYVDVRDAAHAVVLGVTAELPNYYTVLNITAPWPFCEGDIEALVRANYGEVPRRGPIGPADPVYSGRRAEEMLDFRARYRWTAAGIDTMDEREAVHG